MSDSIPDGSGRSTYGGSAQEAKDARRTYNFLSQSGKLLIRHEPGRVILSMAPPPASGNGGKE